MTVQHYHNQSIKVWPVRSPWITSATRIPNQQAGNYRITTSIYQPGIYPATCADTHIVVIEPIEVKHLQVLGHGEWVDWMVDDPAHWLSTWEVAMRCTAPLLIGGLGLGLIHNHLQSNPSIGWYNYNSDSWCGRVDTIEKSEEVVSLVRPYLSIRSQILLGDFFETVPKLSNGGLQYRTVLTDFHMGHQPIDPFITRQQELLNKYMPEAQQLYHAYQNVLDYNMLVEKGIIVLEDA